LVDYPEKEALTAPGNWIGPIHYLAPELLSDPDKAKSGPSDVFSLAKTLWVLATRQNYPLPGFLTRQVPQFHIGSYVVDDRAYILDALVEKATRIDPKQRPTMKDFSDELSAWLEFPRSPSPVDDLSDLQTQISPILQSHIRAQTIQEECTKHVETSITRIVELLRPFAENLEKVTGLIVEIGTRAEISNLPEIQEFSKVKDYLSYRVASFYVQSPTRIGLGNNHIALTGGIILQFTKGGIVHLSGAYAISLGAGNLRKIWLETHDVEFGSAREDQALSSVLDGLRSNLRTAINAFVNELSSHSPT